MYVQMTWAANHQDAPVWHHVVLNVGMCIISIDKTLTSACYIPHRLLAQATHWMSFRLAPRRLGGRTSCP
mgnify:CR=1 FL=1